ncbi:MAG: carboxypeptidase regulatory-like domain-containing protein [Bryobacteraceae bacterium]
MWEKLVLCCALIAAPAALAQEFRGTILGRVTDSSGGIVAGCEVTVTNEATNTAVKATTTGAGAYTIPFLLPGAYTVSVQAAGFRAFQRSGVIVKVQDRVEINVVLEPGVITETVVVRADTPVLETASSSVGQVVAQTDIVNLPMNGRAVYLVARITPGMVPTDTRLFTRPFDNGAVSNVSMGGSRANSNNILLDGIPNMNAVSQVAFVPSPDAVQEMKVQINTYDAEFGRGAGGVLNAVVKAGTNQFHGSLHEFFRNDILEANSFLNNSVGGTKPRQRFHQFGGTAGGPVYLPKLYDGRNRTFVFGSWESIRQSDPTTHLTTVPTAAQRQGDFSSTYDGLDRYLAIYDPFSQRANPNVANAFVRDPFPGNRIPAARMDPVAVKLLEQFAQPNMPGVGRSGVDNFFWGDSSPDNYDSFVTRFDHNFNEKQRLFVRVSASRRPRLGDDDIFRTLATKSRFLNRLSRGGAVDYVNTMGPQTLLNIRYGVSRYGNITQYLPRDFQLSSLGFPTALSGQVVRQQFPRFQISGYETLGRTGDAEDLTDVHTLQVSMTRMTGQQALKWGFESRVIRDVGYDVGYASGTFSFDQARTRGPDPVRDLISGHSVASFLLGTPASGSVDKNVAPAFQTVYYGAYVQDDLRLTTRLTLNLGFRWEYEAPRTERYNQMTRGFAYDTPSPLQGRVPGLSLRGGLLFAGVDGNPRGQTDAMWRNFAPRFGLAYQLHPRVVLRTGYGIYYAGTTTMGRGTSASPGFSVATPMTTSIDGITPYDLLRNPFPNGLLPAVGASQGLMSLVGQSVSFTDVRRPMTYSQQYSFGFQVEPVRRLLIEATYSGNRGIHLQNSNLNVNQLTTEQLQLGDQLIARVPNPFAPYISIGSLAASTTTRAQLLRPYPHFTGVTLREFTDGSSTYHALLLKVERRFGAGLTFLGSYTNSKLLDNVGNRQNNYNLAAERSLSTIHTPQRLTVAGVWEVPIGPGRRWTGGSNPVARKLIEGWQLDWIGTMQTGFPLSVTSNTNTTQSQGGGQRPDSTGTSPKLEGPVSGRLGRYFDVKQFVNPAPYRFGNLARTLPDVLGPGLHDWSLSVLKTTRLGEKLRFELRGEAFNVWNHPAFANPGTSFGTASFGRINDVANRANPARQIQLGAKVLW